MQADRKTRSKTRPGRAVWLLNCALRGYQFAISPLIGSRCRFDPTCSQYMIDALNQWGLLKGLQLGIRRLLRCHPWGGSGLDPVPPNSTPPPHQAANGKCLDES